MHKFPVVEFLCVMPGADTLIWVFKSVYSRKYHTDNKLKNIFTSRKGLFTLWWELNHQWYWNKARYAFILLLMKQVVWQGIHPRHILSPDRAECFWSWGRTWWLYQHEFWEGTAACYKPTVLWWSATGAGYSSCLSWPNSFWLSAKKEEERDALNVLVQSQVLVQG